MTHLQSKQNAGHLSLQSSSTWHDHPGPSIIYFRGVESACDPLAITLDNREPIKERKHHYNYSY